MTSTQPTHDHERCQDLAAEYLSVYQDELWYLGAIAEVEESMNAIRTNLVAILQNTPIENINDAFYEAIAQLEQEYFSLEVQKSGYEEVMSSLSDRLNEIMTEIQQYH